MTTQDWQSVESGRGPAKLKKRADPMAFLAVLMILASLFALMSIFLAIGSAQ